MIELDWFLPTGGDSRDVLPTDAGAHRRRPDHGYLAQVAPNVWAGIGLVRGGVGTTIVGSHEEVADRIVEYHELGFEAFILSGHPHLEEACLFGEGVMPILRRRGYLPEVDDAGAPVFSFR